MNILTVCLGNICRSPLAEGILRSKIEAHRLDWQVDSAGTSRYHDGESPDSRSVAVAKLHGLNISKQRSRGFVVSDYDRFDLILVMDSSNYQEVISLARSAHDRDKVKLILNYSSPDQNKAVPDPYYEGGFDYVYELLDAACEAVIASHI